MIRPIYASHASVECEHCRADIGYHWSDVLTARTGDHYVQACPHCLHETEYLLLAEVDAEMGRQ